jgi:hypothetical protein
VPETGVITTDVDYDDPDRPVLGRLRCAVAMDAELAHVETMAASASWSIAKRRQGADTYYGPVRVVPAGPAVFEGGQATVLFREVFPDEDPGKVQAS